ncbi:hypothetical protein D3C87_1440440 [compost metagenome]
MRQVRDPEVGLGVGGLLRHQAQDAIAQTRFLFCPGPRTAASGLHQGMATTPPDGEAHAGQGDQGAARLDLAAPPRRPAAGRRAVHPDDGDHQNGRIAARKA